MAKGVLIKRVQGSPSRFPVYLTNGRLLRAKAVYRRWLDGKVLIVFIVAAYPIPIEQGAIIRLALVINKVDVDTIGHAIREASPFGREVISGHLSLMTKNIYRRIVI